MRSSIATFSKRFISTFFAATLALGLVPAAAFAAPENATIAASENTSVDNESTQNTATAEEPEAPVVDVEAPDGGMETPGVVSDEAASEGAGDGISTEGPQGTSGEISIPAAMERINEDVALTQPVAQQESTRSYFLAQTLESTKTVPIVSANLPLDKGTADVVESDAEGEGSDSPEDEGGEDSDESDPAPGVIAAASTVVGSFTYEGITFAIEAGGESVALVAVDYNQLPESFIQMQVIVIPEAVTPNGYDYYSVTRIADNAFSSLTKENADPEFVGCEALFAGGDLLAEAGIDTAEVEAFLNPESDMIDIDGDGETDAPANPLKDCTGILAIGIPASVSSIGDSAFVGSDTLQYLVVSEDNQSYATFDGALYSADLTDLRLIPEGRVGAVRVAPSATSVDSEVFSHCPSVTTLVADPESDITPGLTIRANITVLKSGLTPDGFNSFEIICKQLRQNGSKSYSSEVSSSQRTTSSVSVIGTQIYADYGGYGFKPNNMAGADGYVYTRAKHVHYAAPAGLGYAYVCAIEFYTSDKTRTLSSSTMQESVKDPNHTLWSNSANGPFYIPPLDEEIDIPTTPIYVWRTNKTAASSGFLGGCTVTWEPSGGTAAAGVSKSISLKSGSTTAVPSTSAFTKSGYTLEGWYTNSACTAGRVAPGGTTPAITVDTTYYAKWTGNTITMTWNGNGGKWGTSTSTTTSKTYASGATVTLPSTNPTRTGYTFAGWQNSSGGSVTSSTTLPTSNPSYSAKWTANDISITWNANGGKWSDNATTKSGNQKCDANLTLYGTNPTRAGYTFANWWSAASGGTQATTSTKVPTSATTYYAHWTANDITITWNANGGKWSDNATTKSGNQKCDANLTLYGTNPTRAGYTFANWWSAASGGTQATTSTKVPTSATTYYAHWTANDITITWNANGGAWSDGATTKSGNQKCDANLALYGTNPSRTGYTFANWWSAISGGTQKTTSDKVPTAAATYYAHWTANPISITWNANGGAWSDGATTKSGNQTCDANLTLWSPSPDRAGYEFTGWYTSDGTQVSTSDKVPNTATAYYAHWTGKTITVIWNGNGGTWNGNAASNTTKQYAPDTTVPMITTEPVREGYSFAGWWTDAENGDEVTSSRTLPTSNPTYYAHWDINHYTITWVNEIWDYQRVVSDVPYATVFGAGKADWQDHGTYPAHVFVGWQASGADTSLYKVDSSGKLPSFTMKAGDVTFTAVWEAAYEVDFTAENAAFIKSIEASGVTMSGNSFFLKDAHIASGVTVTGVKVNTDYYSDAYGFDKFVVKGMNLSSLGWNYSNGDSWTRNPFTFNESTMATYFPGQNDTLTIEVVFHDEDYTVPGVGEVDPLTHWTATLDLAGGELSASAKGTWKGTPPSVDFTHRSDVIALPTPHRFGWNFKGWSGAYVGHDGTPDCISIATGSIWSRTYTANWTPKTTTVEFSYNAEGPAEGYVGVPEPVSVTFGKDMPELSDKAPTREGYRFIGFFDTDASSGGRLYYASDMEGARAWDKDLGEDESCVLYARWTKESDSAHTHRVIADPASGLMASTPHAGAKGEGQAITVFDADYVGVYAWESYDASAVKPAASDTVTIDVSAYTFKSGFDIKAIPALFDYDNSDPDGPRYRLLGFEVGSGEDATFVKFTELLDGDHFRLTLKGYEMTLSGAGTTPADFKLPAVTVVPVYTDGYPGYDLDPEPDGEVVWPKHDDDDPKDGDRIATVFDANGGMFRNGSSIETTVTVYPASTTMPNAEPTRTGYAFEGWSLSDTHKATCDCDGSVAAPTSKTPRTFYAHWTARSDYRIVYVEVEGRNHVRENGATYGQLLPALGSSNGAPEPEVREGYVFMGYFDSAVPAGSLQYIDASGNPVRAWDIDSSPVYLYAQWAHDTSGEGQEPVTPVKPDPSKPDPTEPPFPGNDDPWKSVPTDEDDDSKSYIKMPVTGSGTSQVLYDGIFEGVMRFTDSTDADKPAAATDQVELTIYSYAPSSGQEAHESFDAVRRAFEAKAPAETPYLQGFKVVSTGWPISITDLHEGRTVVVQCLGADLDWDATYEGSAVNPASAVFRSGKVVAVYSATPVIDPGTNWPDPDGDPDVEPAVPPTQVFNVFDAWCGRFPVSAEENAALTTERIRTVASDYKGKLKLPIAPRYDVEGHEFDGWYLADGTKVDGETIVNWASGKTIYAHYKQIFFTISFEHDVDANQTFDDLEKVWKGQDPANLRAEFQKRVPTRVGYDFVGWAAFPNGLADEDAAIPYYLVGSASDWTGATPAKAVTSDVTLYPLWSGRTYTITWNYVHGRFSHHDKLPFETWEKVRYGDKFDSLPAPASPRYAFFGWFPKQTAAGSATADAGESMIVGADKWFTKDSEGKYTFAPAEAVDTTSDVKFYAAWDETAPVAYTITLHAGEGPDPTFGEPGTRVSEKTIGAAYRPADPSATIDIYGSDCIPYMNLAGWKFTGWQDAEGKVFAEGTKIACGSGNYEFTATWEIVDELGYSITFLKGDEVTTGPDAVDWSFEGDDEYLARTEVEERFDASTETVSVPVFAPTSTTGYDFAGWQRQELDGDGKWQDVTGGSFTTIDEGTVSFSGQQLVQIASAENTITFAFRAIWEPKIFDIRYLMEEGVDEDGNAIYQTMDMEGIDAEQYADVSYDAKVTLPEPAFRNIGAIFERWDARDAASSVGTTLLPGMELSVREIVEAVGVRAIETVDGRNVLSLYGMTTPGMSFTVPLQVNIAFDLERPEESMIAGATAIQTTSTRAVEVKNVELMRYGTDSALELTGGADGSEHVNLLVQAHKAADGSDLDATKYLSMNLGSRNDGARYHASALADYGFDTFMSTQPLQLNYRLALDLPSDGSLTGNDYAKLLGIRNVFDTDGTRASLPVAKLFYTVGLASTTQS